MTQQNPNRQQRRQRSQPDQSRRVRAAYVKSNFCRVIHATGAYGGPTGQGLIYMALYSEHSKLPEMSEFTVNLEAQTVIEEPRAPQSVQWIREVEVEAMLSLEFARSLRKWLDDKIKLLEEATSGDSFAIIEGTTSKEPE